jgi:hypothetical protein
MSDVQTLHGTTQSHSESSPQVAEPTNTEPTNTTPVEEQELAVEIGEGQPVGETYPEAAPLTIKSAEEHAADEKAASEERVARATRATGPRKLSEREKQEIAVLLDMIPEGQSVTTFDIPMEALPENIQQNMFAASSTRSLYQRGLVTPVMDDSKNITGIRLTENAMHLYSKQTSKAPGADGEPKAPKARTGGTRESAKYDVPGVKVKVMTPENPRAHNTQGYHAWKLYRDGMTYRDYMNIKDFPKVTTGSGSEFRGPGRNHFDWDLMKGFIALYDENQPETNEDGTPNSKYWVINNSGK